MTRLEEARTKAALKGRREPFVAGRPVHAEAKRREA